jgi:hypothetical protein
MGMPVSLGTPSVARQTIGSLSPFGRDGFITEEQIVNGQVAGEETSVIPRGKFSGAPSRIAF